MRENAAAATPQRESGGPEGPTDLAAPSLWAVLTRSGAEFRNDNLTVLAAALTYYAVLAAVPGLVVIFTVWACSARTSLTGWWLR